jgi:ABC-type anion transport system duplicated permease subunit
VASKIDCAFAFIFTKIITKQKTFNLAVISIIEINDLIPKTLFFKGILTNLQ